jgi:hypothetical protein
MADFSIGQMCHFTYQWKMPRSPIVLKAGFGILRCLTLAIRATVSAIPLSATAEASEPTINRS